MELIYKGSNERRKMFNETVAGFLILYTLFGSCYNMVKTGHQSADIATGRSQPTALERTFLELVEPYFIKK